MKKISIKLAIASLVLAGFVSCKEFLDKKPLSSVAPEMYFSSASDLSAYADDMYPRIFPTNPGNSYGVFANDAGTDNQIAPSISLNFVPGERRVPNSGGDWSFTSIYRLNFFFANVLPRFGDDLGGSQNTINGNLAEVRHYMGEMYFLRALEYFNRYQKFGDFPIITEPLIDDVELLTEASKRFPRNEVARFILSDLDKAIVLMDGINPPKTRITRDAALLLKSRVALFEGTFLTYFKGTAFVPNGMGWPGAEKAYNAGYQYPNGSIDNEINWFLEQSMAAAKEVADKYKGQLTTNTRTVQQSAGDPVNPYFAMFGQEDLSSVAEVLMWRQYVQGVGGGHDIGLAATQGNWGVGVTRGFVQNFLMADGTPVYTHGTYADGDGYYMGDKTIHDVRINRDSRLTIFLKEPGQRNVLVESVPLANAWRDEPYPRILDGSAQFLYTTGYALRKGGAFDSKYLIQNRGYTAVIVFRAAEALLNYMEASYERSGSLDNSAREYWEALRSRAGITGSIDATISATDMGKEAENDWGAYSGGQVLADRTLYNIRRERRCEYLTEGIRYMDLCRWRAMDQMVQTPYIPEGMHLWNTPMETWYGTALVADGGSSANVSSKTDSEYLRPYRKRNNQLGYNGFVWKMAHYLNPIQIDQFLITAPDGQTISDSPIYQNPYWPTQADQPAIQ